MIWISLLYDKGNEGMREWGNIGILWYDINIVYYSIYTNTQPIYLIAIEYQHIKI